MSDFPELRDAQGKLDAKRAELVAIFAEAGPDLDMSKVKSLDGDSAAKVEAVRTLNDEIDANAKTVENLKALRSIADHAIATDGGEPGDDRRENDTATKSIGEVFAASEARTVKGRSVDLDVDLKTVMSTSAGWAPDVVRGDRTIDFATRPIELLDLIPTVPTSQTAVNYMEETTFTNAAAETDEAGAKPEATLALTERTSAVRKIAVLLPVTDEQLEDVPRIQAYLNNRLPFMVRQRLAGQIIAGDGTPPNLRGLLNTSGIQTQAKGADPTPDAVYKAMTLVRTTGQAEPDAVIFNPLDWQDVRLLRTTDGIYIWGNPSDAGPDRIWGLPVIQAQAMTQNTAAVGAFGMYSELDVKKGLVVETGYNADDFSKNKQTIRAEMRAAIVFYRPAAFCKVTGV